MRQAGHNYPEALAILPFGRAESTIPLEFNAPRARQPDADDTPRSPDGPDIHRSATTAVHAGRRPQVDSVALRFSRRERGHDERQCENRDPHRLPPPS